MATSQARAARSRIARRCPDRRCTRWLHCWSMMPRQGEREAERDCGWNTFLMLFITGCIAFSLCGCPVPPSTPSLLPSLQLGLSVLLCHPAGSDAQTSHGGGSGRSSFGGKGLAISEVIAFLRAVQPRPPPVQSARRAAAPPFGPATSSGGSSSSWRYAALVGSAAVEAVVACTPLLNGHALAVAFLGGLFCFVYFHFVFNALSSVIVFCLFVCLRACSCVDVSCLSFSSCAHRVHSK